MGCAIAVSHTASLCFNVILLINIEGFNCGERASLVQLPVAPCSSWQGFLNYLILQQDLAQVLRRGLCLVEIYIFV